MLIHVIEDDPDISALLEHNLKEEWKVNCYHNGAEGLDATLSNLPDLVILDLMLPSITGLEICRRMKAHPTAADIPIIMLSVKNRESDIVLGLGLGADDYMVKPFSISELVARVRAVWRRCQDKARPQTDIVRIAGLCLNSEKFTASIEDKPLHLTPTEFRLLHAMASAPGRVFSRELLISLAIGDDVTVMEHNVDVRIGAIRRKLGPERSLIETVWGLGYRFRDAKEPG